MKELHGGNCSAVGFEKNQMEIACSMSCSTSITTHIRLLALVGNRA